MLQRWIHAGHLGIGLGVDQTGETVAGRAADALARTGALLVELNAERNVKGLEPEPRPVFAELLQAWLVGHRRMRIRAAGLWLGPGLSARAPPPVEGVGPPIGPVHP